MEIIISGERSEIRKWIRRQERITGKKVNYTGVIKENGECTYFLEEGTKENCPKIRTVRKFIDRSEVFSE